MSFYVYLFPPKLPLMRKIIFPGLCLSVLLLTGCSQKDNTYFEKKLTFPRILTSDQKVKLAAYVVPTNNSMNGRSLN